MQNNLQETRRQGTLLHPLKIYRMDNENGRIDVPYHWQESAEILWMHRGQLGLRVKEEEYEGRKGDIFYVNPRELHGMQAKTQDCIYLAFVFPIQWLLFTQADEAGERYIRPLAELSVHISTHLPKGAAEQVRGLLDEIYSLYESGDEGAWLGIKADLIKFYYHMYREGLAGRREADTRQMDTLLKISRYIQEHCDENLSLKKMGDVFHMSPKYFSVYFQKHFSRRFTDYLTSIRVERAKKLLLETESGMELIAQRTGFSESSYFIRVFREASGMTPGQYRKEFRNISLYETY